MSEPLLLIERDAAKPVERPLLVALEKQIASDGSLPNVGDLGAAALRYEPPFYEDVDLIEIAPKDCTPQDGRLYYLHRAGELYRLNGTSPPIHQVNRVAEVTISAATALDYLAFFCFFVRGDDGPFLIVDRLENRYLPQIADVTQLRKAFREPVLHGRDQNGDWRASALVFYSDAMFFADFLIHLDGSIEMKHDEAVVAELGKKVHAPLNVAGVNS